MNNLNYKYNLSAILQQVNNSTPKKSKNVWVYRNTGIGSAPELVKRCFKQLRMLNMIKRKICSSILWKYLSLINSLYNGNK